MIFCDSSFIIALSVADHENHKKAVDKFTDLSKTHQFALNSTVISESFHKISGMTSKEDAKYAVDSILSSKIFRYLPIELSTIEKSIIVSVHNSVRINDALIGQQALDAKTDAILTDNVKDFKKIPKLKVIPLRS